MTKETYIWQKRHTYDKRDLYLTKEKNPKRPNSTIKKWTKDPNTYINKRDLYMTKETYIWQKRPISDKREKTK